MTSAQRLLTLLTATCVALAASAQTAPAPSSPSSAKDDAIVLSPFTVTTDKDVGFVAANSLAGGRMASDLADTPVAYSVQTKEFLDALNLTNLDDAQEWSPNTTMFFTDAGAGAALGVDTQSTTRGVPSNGAQRNFFAGGYNLDGYNLERFDYTRGPNSILFGSGTISGTANAMTKFARLGRATHEARLLVDSNLGLRFTADINHPVNDTVAVRLNVLDEARKTWRHDELIKKTGIAPSVAFALTRQTELKISGEYATKFNRTMISPFRDSLSAWDGLTTYGALEPLTGSSTDSAKYASHGINRIGSSTAQEFWIFSPDRTRILNYTGTVNTTALTGPNLRSINGVAPLSGNLNIGNVPMIDTMGMPVAPEDLYGPALRYSSFRIPSRHDTNLSSAPIGTDRIRALTAFLSHRIGQSLFLELAVDANRRDNYGNASYWYNTLNTGIGQVFVDVNRTLPTGETNPYYLQPYQQSALDRRYQDYDNRALRLAAAYVKGWKWVDLKFNVMGGADRQKSITVREIGVLPVDPDPRQWGRNGTQTRALRYRLYFNQSDRSGPPMDNAISAVNPLTGVTTNYTPVWTLSTSRSEGGVIQQSKDTDYGQAAAQLSFWKKRFILLGAFRQDNLTTGQLMGLRALSYPTGVTPTRDQYIWRPTGPSDWSRLTYTVKNAAGQPTGGMVNATARPLDANGVPLAQYTGDRFQDDYSPPSKTITSSTKSVGGIWHIARGASVFANLAQTFNPGDASRFTINYGTPPASTSQGYDVGLRYTLEGGRVSASLSRYSSTEKNNTTGNPPGYSNFNPLITTNASGDDNPGGTNKRGLGLLPDLWFDQSDRATEGYEAEIVANFTRQWRITLNVGTAHATQSDAYRDTRSWLAANDTVLRQILTDAGVVIGASGTASVPTNTPVSIDATTGTNAWNSIRTNSASWISGTQLLTRMVKYTTNVYTDYRVDEGKLKGLRLGAGLQYRGPQVIGYRGADTIPDPANPKTLAIDDPAVDAVTPVWTRSYGLLTITAAYPIKLAGKHRVEFNLSVSNALDYERPIYNGTGLRPYGGDLASPARVTVPLAYTYLTPRTFTLSARYTY